MKDRDSNDTSFKVTILGSGPSTGVPMIGCGCKVCKDQRPENKRTRQSLLVTNCEGKNFIFDTATELRLQVLKAGINTLEAVIYTHMHADHTHGFDDLRAFYFKQKKPVQCYIGAEHVEEFRQRFRYAFDESSTYHGTKPQVDLVPMPPNRFNLLGLPIEVAILPHGNMNTYVFKIGRIVYATDFKSFNPELIEKWQGKVDIMIASGLRFGSHATHSSIEESCALMEKLKVKRGIITHMTHDVDYFEDSSRLPCWAEFAFDGMVIDGISPLE